MMSTSLVNDNAASALPVAGRLPAFVIIGAAKSGTTTLYRHLCRHSQVFMCTPKEPEFFSRDDVYRRGEAWYRQLFAAAPDDAICGEASTTYTRWPHTADAADRLHALVPEAKLIYLMRHPVERAFSHYAHHMRAGVTMTFEAALAKDDIYVDCSRYMFQLDRYLQYWPRESLLCLCLEDLQQNLAATLDQVQRFLGLSVDERLHTKSLVANKGGADHYIRQQTTLRMRRFPGMSALADRLPRPWRESAYLWLRRSPWGRRLAQKGQVPPMRSETRAALLRQFEPENHRLAAFLGRDLSHWNQ